MPDCQALTYATVALHTPLRYTVAPAGPPTRRMHMIVFVLLNDHRCTRWCAASYGKHSRSWFGVLARSCGEFLALIAFIAGMGFWMPSAHAGWAYVWADQPS